MSTDRVEMYGRMLAGRAAQVVDAVHEHGHAHILAAVAEALDLDHPTAEQHDPWLALVVALAAAVRPADVDDALAWVHQCDPKDRRLTRPRPRAKVVPAATEQPRVVQIVRVATPMPGRPRPRHVLTPAQTAAIRRRRNAGESPNALATEFGISRQHVHRIATGRTSHKTPTAAPTTLEETG